jgi:hypothetical protein
MKAKLILTLAFAAACAFTLTCAPFPVAEAQENTCGVAELPAPIQGLLKNNFPAMRPKQLSDMGADDQKIWRKAHERDCPGIAVGHFENKDQLAYAIMLVAKSEPTAGYKVGIFSKAASGDSYAWILLNQVEGHAGQVDSSGLAIFKVPPGKYSDSLGSKTIHTMLDGVGLEWMKGGADLFYWAGGKYQKLNISE